MTITDPTGTGTGASATASTNAGFVTEIVVDTHGEGYLTGGIKFQQEPAQGVRARSGLGVPEWPQRQVHPRRGAGERDLQLGGVGPVRHRGRAVPDLVQPRPAPTTVRGYVQVETPAVHEVSQHVALTNTRLDGTTVPVLDANGDPVYGVTAPQWLGPFIMSTKDRPTRVIFHNYLPKGCRGRPLPARRLLDDGVGHGAGPDDGPGRHQERARRGS